MKRSAYLHTKVFFGITLNQLLGVLVFYFCFGAIYWLVIAANQIANGWLVDVRPQMIDYALKAVLTLPIYYVLFVWGREWPLRKKIWLHLLFCPVFLVTWLFLYHFICDQFGLRYLTGFLKWWDVYIPFLFYLMQFGIFHTYDYYRRWMQQKQREFELKTLAAEGQMKALKAQIQPHFLFNTLNSINASLSRENEATRRLISQLADVFRFSLMASEKEWISLREEVLFLKSYLGLEQQRFADRLNLVYEIPDSVLKFHVPPMLLQPLIENAIKHGVSPSPRPVDVHIRILRNDHHLAFCISDSGDCKEVTTDPEQTSTQGNGIGLKNTRIRLQQQFDQPLTIGKGPEGFVVSFNLPINQLPHD